MINKNLYLRILERIVLESKLEEFSGMAGGAVGGFTGKLGGKKNKKEDHDIEEEDDEKIND